MFKTEKSAVPILDIRKCRVYTLENWKSERFKRFAHITSPQVGENQRLPIGSRYITISQNWDAAIFGENIKTEYSILQRQYESIVLSLLLWIVIQSIQIWMLNY